MFVGIRKVRFSPLIDPVLLEVIQIKEKLSYRNI